MTQHESRAGSSLIELIITIALLGIIAGVTVLAVRRIDQPDPVDPSIILADSARVSAGAARSARVRVIVDGAMAAAVANADGSILTDSSLHVERFTGRPTRAR